MVKYLKNKSFYKSLIIIALPVVIQNFISICLNMIDTIMVSSLGENAISAVSLANRIYFIFTTICFGIYSGASIFIAQYWGAKDTKSIKKVFGIVLFIGTFLSVIFSILVFVFSETIMNTFINDVSVIKLGKDYLEIIAFSYFFTAITFAFSFSSRAVHKLKIPTIINVIALSINTIINWLLITGKLGFPALGVKGAAIATLIARIFEFFILLFFIYKDNNHPLAGNLKDFCSWDIYLFKKILKTSFPVILSETAWSIGTSVYMIAYGYLGSYAIAVVQISYIIFDLFMALFLGLGNASSVMIGNEIGKNNLNNAYEYSKKFIEITLVLSLIFSVMLYFLRGNVVNYFNLEENTKYLLSKSLIVFSLYFTPKMFNYIFICGILRSGGDTKFCMFVDIISIWCIGVPISFLSVLILKLPIHLTVALVFSEELFKLVFVLKRFSSKRWINNVIADYETGNNN